MEVVHFSTHRMLEGISRELMTIKLKDYLRDKVCKDMNVEMNQKITFREIGNCYEWYVASPNGNAVSLEDLEKAISGLGWWPEHGTHVHVYQARDGHNTKISGLVSITFEPVSKDKYYLFKQRGLFE